jgi:hypothetical protein
VPASAQTDELTLSVRRNFGYGGGSQIQGSFRMEATGPADLVAVTFKIDEAVAGTDTEAPFRVDFQTDDYGIGWHDLSAVGRTVDGRSLGSETRRFEFVSAEVGWQAAAQIGGILIAVVVGAMLLVFGVTTLPGLLGRRQPPLPLGAPRNYGMLGGTICPRCGRPFPLHLWAFNVSFAGKFDRCDHCGRWSFVRRASPEALRAAEAAELAQAQPDKPALGTPAAFGGGKGVAEPTPEERLRRHLDDSRYVD